MTSSLLASQFAYKAWANAELLQALARIDPDAYPAQRQRAIRLLNHTHVVDRIFAAHLDGGTHPFAASNTRQTPTLGALGAAIVQSDQWYPGISPGSTRPRCSSRWRSASPTAMPAR